MCWVVGLGCWGAWSISLAFPHGPAGKLTGEWCLSPCLQFWQLYNAVTLFELSSHEECKEWQVSGLPPCLSVCLSVRRELELRESWAALGQTPWEGIQ